MATLRYYDPKKTGKELGQIVLTQDGKVKKGTKKDPSGFDKKVRPQTFRAERSNPFALACPASLLPSSNGRGCGLRSQRRISSS